MIKAELINWLGNDLTVVNAARVSFDKASEWDLVTTPVDYTDEAGDHIVAESRYALKEADKRLITYLARHNHFTPFTHSAITLHESAPIFVARQRFKHVVGFVYNEVSRRYVDTQPEFYLPEVWRGRASDKKQGSSTEAIDIPRQEVVELYENAVAWYDYLIGEGVCPEQARMVLPQSMMTSYYVTGSLAAFARAYKLRSDEHAQAEIRDLAKEWDRIIRPLFPVSWSALVD